jgi:hypothetical protein
VLPLTLCYSHVSPKEIANFVDRCHAVALNLVQQLASLYHGKSTGLLGAFSVGGSGPPPQPSLQAHLFSSVAALGALLAVLVWTLPSAIEWVGDSDLTDLQTVGRFDDVDEALKTVALRDRFDPRTDRPT